MNIFRWLFTTKNGAVFRIEKSLFHNVMDDLTTLRCIWAF
jgi:hypothetical protein